MLIVIVVYMSFLFTVALTATAPPVELAQERTNRRTVGR